MRHGAFDFIQKPFHTAELIATVSRALERRRLRRTAGLYEASRTILDAHEPHRLPELIIQLAMQAMQADDASIMLPDAEGKLYIAHFHSLSPEVRQDVRIRIGERVAGRVVAQREPVVIADSIANDSRFSDLTAASRARSSIVYPLLVGQRFVGVLCINRLGSCRPFRRSDLEGAAILASQVLLALENARLVRQVASSERLASVGLLATGVAHEINNPTACVLANHSLVEDQLSTLDRFAHLLDAGADGPALRRAWGAVGGATLLGEMREALGDIGVGAATIRDIVRDLKALTRHDASKPTMFDVNEPLRSALRITGAEVRHRAVVTTELGADLDVFGSPGRLSQVFVNLLVNAAQACAASTKADARGHEIAVRSRRDGDRVLVTVTDDGPGIRPEHLSRVFETFFTTKGASIGTGLGLSISREIVESYGGELRVESTFGRGATFIVTLPFAGSVVRESSAVDIEAMEQPATNGGRSVKFRVLFIDDERSLLKTYERAFGREHDVVLAEGGGQALAILVERSDFDLVVCDLLMPHLSGMEVYRRACEAHPELDGAFIFVTGGVTQHDVQAFLRTVGNQILEKPFDFASVRAIIDARAHAKTS